MPQRGNNQPPEAMTNAGRLAIVIAAVIVDALRFFFTMFWFFGPALAAAYCVGKASDYVGSLWGLTAIACGGVATVAGAAISEITIPLGTFMSMAVGFAGFLALGLWILMTNSRILKTIENAPLQFVGAFALSEIPFVGAFPIFSVVLWRLYGAQIRVEQAALKEWEKKNTQEIADQRRAQQQQAAYLMQMRNVELAEDAIY